MAKLVSKVYGDALFGEAIEKQELGTVFDEVKALRLIWKENPGLAVLLDNPKIVKEEKIDMVQRIFAGRVSDDLMGFLTVIVDKGRQKDIPAICDYFIDIVREYKRIGVAHVVSAVELRAEQKAALSKRLLDTTKYVEFEMVYEVDPTIIGGLVVRIGDRVVDSSIKTQIAGLRSILSKLQLS